MDLGDLGPPYAMSEWGLMVPATLPQLLATAGDWHITKSNMTSYLVASFSQEILVTGSVESQGKRSTHNKRTWKEPKASADHPELYSTETTFIFLIYSLKLILFLSY